VVALDDERRVVREGGLSCSSLGSSCPSISALSPLDRFRLEEMACFWGGGLLAGSVDSLAEERVERRGGMCMLYEGKHGIESKDASCHASVTK
jgi:hypothetical protein